MTGRGATGGGGGNLVLAALLALLSYAPFEYVAKISLVINMMLFVVDPFPPNSRLLALVSTVVVAGLSALHKRWQEEQAQREKEEQEIFEKEKVKGQEDTESSNEDTTQTTTNFSSKKSQ
jgi:flagellar biosynthesis component FlhA